MPTDMLRYSEIRRIAQAFRKATSQLQAADFYWLPGPRRIVAVDGGKAAPTEAVFVGRYAYPCSSGDFVDDLNWILANGADH